MKIKKKVLSLIMVGMMSMSMVACSSTDKEKDEDKENGASAAKEITLVTTTSLEDTGFLEDTLVDFEKENNVDVKVVAKGTGEALELGKSKDADILFVHAKQKEEDFIKEGYGTDRHEIMYNYFIVVGPENEHTAKMKDMSVTDAFKYIKENDLNFISRGDESGTHTKELALWEKAGEENKFDNYKEAGQGMGATLTMANEMQAYTLTDIGTYLATKGDNKDLGVVINADESLKNVYSIVSISELPKEKEEVTNKLIEYYKSDEMKTTIKEYGVDKYGEPLFFIFE